MEVIIMEFERWLEQVAKVWHYDMLAEHERLLLIRRFEKWLAQQEE
jgi:hypothetical protein